MYRFKLYNSIKCLNYINKSFNLCYQNGNNNIIIKHRDYKDSVLDRKKCLKNQIPTCCIADISNNYIPIGNLPFIIVFKYIGTDILDIIDFGNNYLPIDNRENGFTSLSYEIFPNVVLPGTIVTLKIYWVYKYIPGIISGVTFNLIDNFTFDNSIRDWWNNNTEYFNITQWGNIPLSRGNNGINVFDGIIVGNQFQGLLNIIIDAIDTPTILPNTSFQQLFSDCSNFNSFIGNWNTSNVQNMNNVFTNNNLFNNGDIGDNRSKPLNWVTSNVKFMNSMFDSALSFNQSVTYDPVNKYWDLSSLTTGQGPPTPFTSLTFMFNNASIFNNGDIPGGSNKPMGWIPPFGTLITPSGFSTNCPLTVGQTGNSPFFTQG